ncbi:hypothetical protein SDRG_09270 [Saprolegnia diclina VS20]|uniref:Uncharacterized protein n=1 Tax=Saprolegnia diclina (strain VS20) TaxID=1156394 RepID=T0Q5Y9_SAPDV|nr:hypothetical protein SDRG_09270 [Saprolegnia diclina VS20]EQC33289.1 hypothetical protein SDRG_09270 [Saprolegnia diclina VS20]|eukprot:XP_008613412.1 hypothetical protein SDRG_09270 [Saprolegnia diclina VS20]
MALPWEAIVGIVLLLIFYVLCRILQNYVMYTRRGYEPIPDAEKPGLSAHLITHSKDSVEILIEKDRQGRS